MKKGEIYERNLFTAQNKLFKQENFTDEVKHFYTDLINHLIEDEKEKLHVFDSNGLYLATKKIGKNNSKAEQIQTDNEKRMRWNQIIFETEKERNFWELERDDLKGFARFTKKGELQSKIGRKNEEIDILKIVLSGIIKRCGFQNVQEFCRIYHKSHSAYVDYREQVAEWEKTYGDDSQRQDKKSVLERLENPPKRTSDYQQQRTIKNKDRGAR